MAKYIPLSVPSLKGDELKYVKECIDTEWVSSAGKYVDKFERDIASDFKHVFTLKSGFIYIISKFQNFDIVNTKNINFFNIGIDSNNRIAKFYIRKPVSHSSLLDSHPDEEFNEVVSTSEVEVKTLDSFIEKHNVKVEVNNTCDDHTIIN